MEPEEEARKQIDKMLKESGWILQDYKDLDLGAGFGIAVREYPLSLDASDYALFIDRNPVGVLEAKPKGWTLRGVTPQSDGYLKGLKEKFPNAPRIPPFSYESTGVETIFADAKCDNMCSIHEHMQKNIMSCCHGERANLLLSLNHACSSVDIRVSDIPALKTKITRSLSHKDMSYTNDFAVNIFEPFSQLGSHNNYSTVHSKCKIAPIYILDSVSLT